MKNKNYAIILAGGSGSRLGEDIPKQYIYVNGRMIIEYCLETIALHEMISGIQIVAVDNWQGDLGKSLEKLPVEARDKFIGFSKPGENRQQSVYNALEDLAGFVNEQDSVMIHDAARPLLQADLITDSINKLDELDGHYDGVMPVLPMKDTVYFCKDGRSVSSLLNREQIFAGQAPELFKYGKYLAANRALLPDKILEINGSTEPAIMAGMNIAMIAGDERNFKITTAADLERFREVIEKIET